MANPLRVWTADDLIVRSVPPVPDAARVRSGAGLELLPHGLRHAGRGAGESQRQEVRGPAAGAGHRSSGIAQHATPARRHAAAARIAHAAGGRFPGFDLLESLVRLLGGIDVEHLRPWRVDPGVRHWVAALARHERRNRGAGQRRTRRKHLAGLLRTGDARLPAMDRAASRVLGHVHDDGLRSDDRNFTRGHDSAEPRIASERAAEQRDHRGDLEAADARPPGSEVVPRATHGARMRRGLRAMREWSPMAMRGEGARRIALPAHQTNPHIASSSLTPPSRSSPDSAACPHPSPAAPPCDTRAAARARRARLATAAPRARPRGSRECRRRR